MINATKVLVIVLTIATMVSPFSFRSGGLITGTITRKTIIVISTCFLGLMFSIWIGLSLSNPSQSISALLCLGGVAIMPCTYLLLLYLRLPRIIDRHQKIFSDAEIVIHKNKDDHTKDL
jgi:hypothetical protein